MTGAEKAVTRILATVKVKRHGPRMIHIPKKALRELMVVAFKYGVVEGIKKAGKAMKR